MLTNSSIIEVQEQVGGGVSKLEDAEGHWEMRLSRHNMAVAHVNIQQLWVASTRPSQPESWHSGGRRSPGHPPFTEKPLEREGTSLFFEDVSAGWLPSHEWEALPGPAVSLKRKKNGKKLRVEHTGEGVWVSSGERGSMSS